MDDQFKTPMLKQYQRLKDRYPDCLLFFRLGDFYELFFEDAKIGSEVMNITLTKRSRGIDGRIPMCGVPFHAAENYIAKLVKAGYKVAIAEQVTDPTESKGLVEREVIRIVTPGTVLNEKLLEKKENNFLLCVNQKKDKLGFAFADLGTGMFQIHEIPFTSFEKDLSLVIRQIEPKELLLPPLLYENPHVLKVAKVEEDVNIFLLSNWNLYAEKSVSILLNHFGVKSLSSFGIEKKDYLLALEAAANLLTYLKETQKSNLSHFLKITPYVAKEYLKLDSATVANLELFKTVRGQSKKGSLLNLLDQTHTAMGGRLMRQWLLQPLANAAKIKERLDTVEVLVKESSLRQKLQNILKEIIDIERLLSRLALSLGSPRDLDGLKFALRKIQGLGGILDKTVIPSSKKIPLKLVKATAPLIDFIEQTIIEDPPFSSKEGGFIKKGVSAELDRLRELLTGDRDWLSELQERERRKTGIEKLKIESNKIYGYYIEVTKANVHLVPDYYIRKQTLVGSERYLIPELKLRESQVFEAQEKVSRIELELFTQSVEKVLEFIPVLQQLAVKVAEIDCLVSLAQVAEAQNYVIPDVVVKGDLMIKNGRHPVVESLLFDTQFIPNHTQMSEKDSLLLLITGPNMSGKSTYLRQVALIVLMAQVGSFVSAQAATIPLTDQIFTRVGASDSLSEGQSTFLVEMIETANILNNATGRSLVVFDEIGRGTSTFDGMSIAWAVVEYLLGRKNKRPKTLFATHYHELTVLSDKYPEIKNMQMAVAKEKGEIVFLKKVITGAQWESYGIEVAKLAGLPQPVIKRAQEILYRLKANQNTLKVTAKKARDESGQMKLM